MNILKSSTLIIPAVALVFITLAGCSTNSATTDPGTASSEATSSSSAATTADDGFVPPTHEYYDITETDPRAQSFVTQYRSSFPGVAGRATRPDRYILSVGTKLCTEISWQEQNDKHIMNLADMKKFVTPRVTGDIVTRLATDAEADGISRLAVNTLCPVYVPRLK
jgi:hypothetical protein